VKPYYDDGKGHVIYHASCLEVMAAQPATSIDAIWTDPPYGNSNHDGDWNAALNKMRGLVSQPIANDSLEDMKSIVDAMLTESARILKKQASICCCCTGGLSFSDLGQKEPRSWLAIQAATRNDHGRQPCGRRVAMGG